jgi:hypothetical protein
LGQGIACTHHERIGQRGLNGSHGRGRFTLIGSKHPGVKSGDLSNLIGVHVQGHRRQHCMYQSSEAGTGWTLGVSRQVDHLHVAVGFAEVGYVSNLIPVSYLNNQALVVGNPGDDSTDGDGTLAVTVYYTVVTLA